jgi:hypothetical protein
MEVYTLWCRQTTTKAFEAADFATLLMSTFDEINSIQMVDAGIKLIQG